MGLGTGALHNGVDHYRCNAFRIIKSCESNSLTLIASLKFCNLCLHLTEAGGVCVGGDRFRNKQLSLFELLSQGKRCKLYVYIVETGFPGACGSWNTSAESENGDILSQNPRVAAAPWASGRRFLLSLL